MSGAATAIWRDEVVCSLRSLQAALAAVRAHLPVAEGVLHSLDEAISEEAQHARVLGDMLAQLHSADVASAVALIQQRAEDLQAKLRTLRLCRSANAKKQRAITMSTICLLKAARDLSDTVVAASGELRAPPAVPAVPPAVPAVPAVPRLPWWRQCFPGR